MANKFVLNQEDGTVEGGNVRGVGSVDLQMSRTAADQVASGLHSFCVGSSNKAIGRYAIAMGLSNTVNSSDGVGAAIGWLNTTGKYSFALGIANNSSGEGSIALGNSATASGGISLALGYQSLASGSQSISLGRRCTSSSQYSTVSGGELNTASTNTHATVVGGYQNSSTGQYSVSGGYSNTASDLGTVALGYNSTASGDRAVSIGTSNVSTARRSVAIGQLNTASNENAISIGVNHTASGQYSSCIGGSAHTSSGQFSCSIGGYLNDSNGYRATSIGGYNNESRGDYSYALGYKSIAYLRSQFSFSNQPYGFDEGNSQFSDLVASNSATLTTGATTTLYLDGVGATELIIPLGTNRVWNVTVETQAVVTNTNGTSGIAAGDVYSEVSKLTFKKIGGVSSLVGIISRQFVFDGGMGTAQMNYSAGASQELAIEFQAPAFGAGDITVRVVSKVSLVEVAY